ncbi:Flp family type IVb pilin [Tessaracoccus sp. MC1756]|nr:Flp family type IVb pilin [Tessaracoccus sp. MC1756]
METVLRGVIGSRMKSEKGATAVEYGIMVAAIAAVIIATVLLIGPELNEQFNKVLKGLQDIPA